MTYCNTRIHCARRPRKSSHAHKQDIGAQARHWRSDKTVGEGDRPSAIVKNHSQLEVIAAGLRQLSQSLKVTSIHGSTSLDFDADDSGPRRSWQAWRDKNLSPLLSIFSVPNDY